MLQENFKVPDNLYQELESIFEQLRGVAVEPQKSYPDVLIWMYSGDKGSVGYARVPVEDLISGSQGGGFVRTVLLRALKSKRDRYQDLIKAKLEMRLWIGCDTSGYMENAPGGYEVDLMAPTYPYYLTYKTPHKYRLRAYMYQGRTVLGSDDSGLSDPFVRIVFGHHVVMTRIIEQTRSPVWDQMFDLEDIEMCQSPEELERSPPVILLNVFDMDDDNKEEFLGQAVANPHILGNADREKYKPRTPRLEWLPVSVGDNHYGEVLACFELYNVSYCSKISFFRTI